MIFAGCSAGNRKPGNGREHLAKAGIGRLQGRCSRLCAGCINRILQYHTGVLDLIARGDDIRHEAAFGAPPLQVAQFVKADHLVTFTPGGKNSPIGAAGIDELQRQVVYFPDKLHQLGGAVEIDPVIPERVFAD